MKLFCKSFALIVILIAGVWLTPQEASAQGSVSFQLFYDGLSPYGSWVNYPNYGYVWIPDVDREFSPYGTYGHWIFTIDGWMWVSDYPWGWAPFHYGRWAYDDYYGWLWVPNNEWGPAWVTWRRSEGYYGWAPMGPGITVEVSFGDGYRVPNEHWIFVRDRDISRPDIYRHYVDRSTNVTIIKNSKVINNTYTDKNRNTKYVAGPTRDDVQKITGTAIKPVAIRENDKPGQTLRSDQIKIYRPHVQMSNNNDHKPVPSKLVNLKEVKPVSERKPENRQRDVKSTNNSEKKKPPGTLNPPNKGQPSQPRKVSPSGTKIKEKQSQNITPQKKKVTVLPKTSQDNKEKKKRE
jgi:hypothetical protein